MKDLELDAKLYRRNGRWHIVIEGPRWVLADVEDECRTGTIRIASTAIKAGNEQYMQMTLEVTPGDEAANAGEQ